MSAGQTKLAKSPRVTKKRVFLFAVLLIVSIVSMWVHPIMMASADPNTADVGLSAHYVNGTAVRGGYILVVAYSGSSIYEDGYFSTNFQFNVGSAYTIHGGNVSNAYFDYWLTPGSGAPVSGAYPIDPQTNATVNLVAVYSPTPVSGAVTTTTAITEEETTTVTSGSSTYVNIITEVITDSQPSTSMTADATALPPLSSNEMEIAATGLASVMFLAVIAQYVRTKSPTAKNWEKQWNHSTRFLRSKEDEFV